MGRKMQNSQGRHDLLAEINSQNLHKYTTNTNTTTTTITTTGTTGTNIEDLNSTQESTSKTGAKVKIDAKSRKREDYKRLLSIVGREHRAAHAKLGPTHDTDIREGVSDILSKLSTL
ncbi:hypothetical protein AX774_g345 [Zancudomyces culisetae]|uniref:Uncharacterized protein n=1 Tax=Zancudomyces culisetae TaxID=1213189 RepID=A0A1R1PYW0_ZANCU|nr:hypothetical protein AX774_g345 [Zancudomyces culisetae]|eukprot:OMH86114.1 hypothetical protein AX774_g345 [Zancudomyces culisetae]